MAKRSSARLLVWLVALALLVLIAASVGLVLVYGNSAPSLSENPKWLEIRISSKLDDAPGSDGLFLDPSQAPPLTTEMTRMIRDAANDPKVRGIFLHVRPIPVGWAQTQEIRSALMDFRASGKPCNAWGAVLGNKEYYLASACDKVWLAPAGLTLVNGLAVSHLYYKDTLEKLGIEADLEYVGAYKTAVEPFQRTGPSDAAIEAMNSLLDSLFGQLTAGIAEGRKVDRRTADGWVNDPPLTPKNALAKGMIDGVLHRDQAIAELDPDAELTEDDLTSMYDYLEQERERWNHRGPKLAVIYAEGTIVSGKSSQSVFGSRFLGARTINHLLQQVRDDDDVKAVVLRVNSPGGSGQASDDIWRQVELTRQSKPVVVSMADYAASGGYYLSAAADYIVAEPGTLTGSIGVFGGKMVVNGLFEKVGVHVYTFKRGPFSTLMSPTSDFSDADRAKFRTFLQAFYDTFLNRVATGRNMSLAAVQKIAQGRVWTGRQALDIGLVDELGGLEEAIAVARKKAGVTGRVAIEALPKRKSFLDKLIEDLTRPDPEDVSAQLEAVAKWMPDAAAALSTAEELNRVLADGGIAALMPMRIEVRSLAGGGIGAR